MGFDEILLSAQFSILTNSVVIENKENGEHTV